MHLTFNNIDDALLAQIRAVIRKDMQAVNAIEAANAKLLTKLPTRFRTFRIIFDEDCPGITNPLAAIDAGIDLTTPNCTVCEYSITAKQYTQTVRRLRVVNWSSEDYATDDAAWGIPQDGLYIAGGCPQPVTSRPTPPWSE